MSDEASKGADDVWKAIGEAAGGGSEGIVVTIVAARGSIPGMVGAKALVGGSGVQIGNLGGGKVEAAAIRRAKEILASGEMGVVLETWNLQRDLGMTCGGEVTFLFERVGAKDDWHIVVFGAGHVAQALVPLLATLRCRIDVVDPRPGWLSRIRPHIAVTTHGGIESYLEGAEGVVGKDSHVLCVTQGHQTDLPVVKWVLERFPTIPFMGVIGSEVKRAKLLAELRECGLSEALVSKLHCPVGLPIGSNDPAEIAVSIAAQLLDVRGR